MLFMKLIKGTILFLFIYLNVVGVFNEFFILNCLYAYNVNFIYYLIMNNLKLPNF